MPLDHIENEEECLEDNTRTWSEPHYVFESTHALDREDGTNELMETHTFAQCCQTREKPIYDSGSGACSDGVSEDKTTCEGEKHTWTDGVCSNEDIADKNACEEKSIHTWTDGVCRKLEKKDCTDREKVYFTGTGEGYAKCLNYAYNCPAETHWMDVKEQWCRPLTLCADKFVSLLPMRAKRSKSLDGKGDRWVTFREYEDTLKTLWFWGKHINITDRTCCDEPSELFTTLGQRDESTTGKWIMPSTEKYQTVAGACRPYYNCLNAPMQLVDINRDLPFKKRDRDVKYCMNGVCRDKRRNAFREFMVPYMNDVYQNSGKEIGLKDVPTDLLIPWGVCSDDGVSRDRKTCEEKSIHTWKNGVCSDDGVSADKDTCQEKKHTWTAGVCSDGGESADKNACEKKKYTWETKSEWPETNTCTFEDNKPLKYHNSFGGWMEYLGSAKQNSFMSKSEALMMGSVRSWFKYGHACDGIYGACRCDDEGKAYDKGSKLKASPDKTTITDAAETFLKIMPFANFMGECEEAVFRRGTIDSENLQFSWKRYASQQRRCEVVIPNLGVGECEKPRKNLRGTYDIFKRSEDKCHTESCSERKDLTTEASCRAAGHEWKLKALKTNPSDHFSISGSTCLEWKQDWGEKKPFGGHRCNNGHFPLGTPKIGNSNLYNKLENSEILNAYEPNTGKTEAEHWFDQLGITMVEDELIREITDTDTNTRLARFTGEVYGSITKDTQGELLARLRHLFEYTNTQYTGDCYPQDKNTCEDAVEVTDVTTDCKGDHYQWNDNKCVRGPVGFWNDRDERCVIELRDINSHYDCAAVYKEEKNSDGSIKNAEKPIFDHTDDKRCRVPENLVDCTNIERTFFDKDLGACRYIETHDDCLVNDSSKPILVDYKYDPTISDKNTCTSGGDVVRRWNEGKCYEGLGKDTYCRERRLSDCEHEGRCEVGNTLPVGAKKKCNDGEVWVRANPSSDNGSCHPATESRCTGLSGTWISHPVFERGRCRQREAWDCFEETPMFSTTDRFCYSRCPEGEYYNKQKQKCQTVTVCPSNKKEKTLPTPISDRECEWWGGSCPSGLLKQQQQQRTRDNECESCESPHVLKNGSCCRTYTSKVSHTRFANKNPMTIETCYDENNNRKASIDHEWFHGSAASTHPWSMRIEGMDARVTGDRWTFTANKMTRANANGYCEDAEVAQDTCSEGTYKTCEKNSNPENCLCSKPPTTCENWTWDSDWKMAPVAGVPPVFDKYEDGIFSSNGNPSGTYTPLSSEHMSMSYR